MDKFLVLLDELGSDELVKEMGCDPFFIRIEPSNFDTVGIEIGKAIVVSIDEEDFKISCCIGCSNIFGKIGYGERETSELGKSIESFLNESDLPLYEKIKFICIDLEDRLKYLLRPIRPIMVSIKRAL